MAALALGLVGGVTGAAALLIATTPLIHKLARHNTTNRIVRDLALYRDNYWSPLALDSNTQRQVVNECIDIVTYHGTGEAQHVVPHGRCRTPNSPRFRRHKTG